MYWASNLFRTCHDAENAAGGNFALVGQPSVGASGAIYGTQAAVFVDLMAHWKIERKPVFEACLPYSGTGDWFWHRFHTQHDRQLFAQYAIIRKFTWLTIHSRWLCDGHLCQPGAVPSYTSDEKTSHDILWLASDSTAGSVFLKYIASSDIARHHHTFRRAYPQFLYKRSEQGVLVVSLSLLLAH